MNDVRVVAFDCDGVMFDSKEANTAYYNTILNQFNMPAMTPEQLDYAHMHSVDAVLPYLFKDEKILEAAKVYQQQMGYRQFIQYMTIAPDLRDLLKWLRPRFKTAVATNRTYTMEWVLAEFSLDTSFDLVVCARDVERPKPEPDMLDKIVEYFRIAPHQALYVGDSEVDEMAANAANVPLVAFNNPSLRASFHITSLSELKGILKNSHS